ncbi:MAG: DUF4437 domain-containing protein [Myxococcaceae bacterium]
MKKLMLACGLMATIAVGAQVAKKAESHLEQSQLTWTTPFGPQGPQFGFVEGKMGDKKPASFFVKFPAGGDSGWHIHDEDYQAVVVKGTFAEQQQGEPKETLLPAGSYFTQTGKLNHRNGCTKDGDCLLYVHFDKGASSYPTTPEGKLVPMPAPAK